MSTAEKIAVNRFKPTKNFYVFFICLLLAFFFWLLNVLGKTYTTVIYVPIKYENLPVDKIALNKLPETFAVKANVFGYGLLVGNTGEKNDTIVIDALNFNQIKRRGENLSYLHVSPILKQLTANNYSSYVISEVLIDTLFIKFDKKIVKVLEIIPNFKIELAKHYILGDAMQLFPERIRITGPKSILDTMTILNADSLIFKDVKETITAGLTFQLVKDKRFTLSPKNALATIHVDKNTESSIEIPVTYINVPKNILLKTFPNKVKLTFLIAISKFKEVNKNDFKVIVDYNDISQEDHKLTVVENKSPKFVTITKIEPNRLEYIIKK